MVKDPFPSSALAENRAGRLTAEQIRDLHADAVQSKRSGSMAGLALLALGLFILWGTSAGRVPGPRLQSFAVGGAIAIVGGLLLASGGMSRGPSAARAASPSTVLDQVEGRFRRERVDLAAFGSHRYTTRGDARYDYYLHVGERRLRVSQVVYDASPDDGLVRVYVLPQSDRIVNLERIGDAPTPLEMRAAAVLHERFDAVPPGAESLAAGKGTPNARELHAVLVGAWQSQALHITLEFRADGTVVSGAEAKAEVKRWEALDGGRIRMDGDEQRVQVDGDVLLLSTDGPAFRFHRLRR